MPGSQAGDARLLGAHSGFACIPVLQGLWCMESPSQPAWVPMGLITGARIGLRRQLLLLPHH